MPDLYYPLSIQAIEDVEEYRPGGFHPVHIGDIYGGRYKVLHKLGAGGYSTTWLARDTAGARYVALKVVSASETANCVELHTQQRLPIKSSHPGRAHVRSLLAHFIINGPNGTHYCLVSEVAGPTLISVYDTRSARYARRLRPEVARKISKQVVQAVGFLHAEGVGHGDITVPNILLKLRSMDKCTEEEIYERFGQPRTEKPRTVSGSTAQPSAPEYIVEAAKAPDVRFLEEEIYLIDLGVSFQLEEPPKPEDIGVPLMYRAPETVFESRYDRYSEIWSLACVFFEIRAGTPMFERFIGSEDEIVEQWVQMKGKMPEPWWSSWEARSSTFDEAGKPHPRGPDGEVWTKEYPLSEAVADIGDDEESSSKDTDAAQGQTSLLDVPGNRISEIEAQELENLLAKMFAWKGEDRISVEQVLEHQWFAERDQSTSDQMGQAESAADADI